MKNKKLISLLLLFSVVITLICFSACGEGKNAPTALPFPQIELTGNVISWNEVENAENYEIYENGEKVAAQSETSYTVTKTAKGTYKFKIKAIDADGVYSASEFSNEVTYTVETDKLSAPKISKQDNIISWTAVQHADGYEVYENGVLVTSQAETSFTIQKTEAGTYRYTVKAISNSPDYTASEFSNEVTHIISTQLAAPEISLVGRVISWEPVQHAETYVIYENDYVILQSWAQTSYTIQQTLVGHYTYCVVAKSSDLAFKMSPKSNSVEYEALPVPLETPSNLSVDGNLLSWSEVENAGGYNVYENERLVSSKQPHSPYAIPLDKEPGTYIYTVEAVPVKDDPQYLNSELSQPYEYILSDERQTLATPQNVRTEQRDENKIPDDPSQGTISVLYLLWDSVDNASGYFIYEDGNRIYATQAESYVISEIQPGRHKYQVKAISTNTNYKSSELSSEVEYVVNAQSIEFTITLDKTYAAAFNSAVTVSIFAQDNNGFPVVDTNNKINIPAGGSSGKVTLSNGGRYVAKITSSLSGYYASEVKLSATATSGTISIYDTSLSRINLNQEKSFTAESGDTGNVGAEQMLLFVAPAKGQYMINADSGMICTVNGAERYLFSADENEAILLTVNCQSAGMFNFKISTATKQYINFGEMSFDGPSGQSNTVYADQSETKFYMHASAEAKRYTFLFTTATMGNTRFVTLTINGVDYEFDGAYCTSLNITIPESATDIEITIKVFGEAREEGLANVGFYVIPLT